MKRENTSNKCRQIRAWLGKVLAGRFDLSASWIQNHITDCPRCRQRLMSLSKVNLALSMIKSQPHNLDLLMRANAQTIGVLKHSLRQAPKALKLKTVRPEPRFLERCRKYAHPAANAAACIAILLLAKVGVFSSMNKVQTKGQEAMKQYYTSRVGEDLADELFTA